MKIGVITFFESYDNYGQLLQGYALQQTLLSWGHDAEIIRYCFNYKKVRWLKSSTYRNKQRKESMLKYCSDVLDRWKDKKLMKRNFDSFRHKHLRMSKAFYNSLEELQNKVPHYDCYITGSDQVWAQYLRNPDNRVWFLDFGKEQTLRIAYAPSFAVKEYPTELHDELTRQLSRLDAVSVRESSGIDICKAHSRSDAMLVVDPTMLAPTSIYKYIISPTDRQNYCFIYHVNVLSADNIHWSECKTYNKNKGLSTIATFANPQEGTDMEFVDGAEYIYPTIGEWLGHIASCTYLLTSSFHGVVFAIIFHRPFIACLRPETTFAGNGRITTLLENLGLDHLIAPIDKSIDPDSILSMPIDWDEVDRRLEAMRNSSIDFLRNALNIKK